MNRVQVKQALNLNSNEHVSSPKTVVKQVKVGVMNSPYATNVNRIYRKVEGVFKRERLYGNLEIYKLP